MVAQGEFAEPWKPDEPRYNRLVFIGKNLDRERIVSGFNACRDLHGYIAEAEIAGPGFINLRLESDVWRREIQAIASLGADYGRSDMGKGMTVA